MWSMGWGGWRGKLEDIWTHVPVSSQFTVPILAVEHVILGLRVRVIVEVKPATCVCVYVGIAVTL